MATDVIGYLYAATVAAGGIMGYVKAGIPKRVLCNLWMNNRKPGELFLLLHYRFHSVSSSRVSFRRHFG